MRLMSKTLSLAIASGLAWAAVPGLPSLMGAGPGGAALAQTSTQAATPVDGARIAALAQAMQLGPLLAVMREEGLDRAEEMDQSMLGGQGGVPFRAEAARLYDPLAARAQVEAALLQAMQDDPAAVTAAEAFFGSALGQKAVALEVEARRAYLDPATREAAGAIWAQMQDNRDPRVAKLTALVLQTEAIEMNVKGQAEAGLAFYRGLREGGGLTDPMSDAEVIADLAARSDAAYGEVSAWLYPYLALAYEPLSPQEMTEYTAFLTSPAGQAWNRANFAAFNALFVQISHGLGLAVSHQLSGQEI